MAQPGENGASSAMDVDPAADSIPSRVTATTASKIPPLTTIVPSIFVPLEEDLTQPIDLPRDRVERLKWILDTIESQRTGVLENMLYLIERERDRILAEALENEVATGPPDTRKGLPPDEVDWVISNMEAPHQPDLNYNIQDLPPRTLGVQVPGLSNREQAVWQLLELVERAVSETRGYDKHMGDIRAYYLGMLEKEKQKIDEAGKRPEERSRTNP